MSDVVPASDQRLPDGADAANPLNAASAGTAESLYRSLFEHSRDPIYVTTYDGRFLAANRAALEFFGYTHDELLALDAREVYQDPAERAAFARELEREGSVQNREVRFRTGSGVERVGLETAVVQRDDGGHVVAFQGIIHDITERKEAEERLRLAALHDALTQLPNRTLFTERLTRLIERLRWRPDYRFAVLFVDLDRFKLVNDSLGHRVGDELLTAVAGRLSASVRPEDTVARLGGDEFAILLVDLPSIGEAMSIANRIQDSLRRPFHILGQEIYATASVGIALSTTGYSSPEEVLRDADTAMYRAKGQDSEKCVVFNEEMHARAVALLDTEMALRRALQTGEFVLHYQPIVALESHSIVGFEALLRWSHPERGLLPPSEFLQVAEETGLIVLIGQWVLREACRALRGWRAEAAGFGAAPIVSVNLSGRQLLVPTFADQVRHILEEANLPGEALRLEVTETVLLENAAAAQRVLLALKELGVRLCLDDFGTGYSSLTYLRDLPVDVVKIDRSFTSRLGGSQPEESDIVGTILTLARQLSLGAIAEGVETTPQARDLAELGCTHAQGYLYSRPVSAAEARAMLRWGLGTGPAEGAAR